MKKAYFSTGFTFVELMLSVAIFAVVGVAVASTMKSGFDVWKRARKLNVTERQNTFKIEKIKKELRQTFVFKKEIPFYINNTVMSFVLVGNETINKITYSFDPKAKILLRASTPLKTVIESKDDLKEEYFEFLNKIDNLTFECFYQDLKSGNYTWGPKWDKENLMPQAVRININYTKEQSDVQTVVFPFS